MIEHTVADTIRGLSAQLAWLKAEAARRPAPWVLSHIAQLEGVLAAERARLAWLETQRIFRRFATRV
jgi:hypothetical protein